MALSFALEKRVAISAVARACNVTTGVFNKLVKGETLVKGDKSPVTVADFSAQAVVNSILSRAFPEDPIVGEEDSADLRVNTPQAKQLREHLTSLANTALRLPLRLSQSSSSTTESEQDIAEDASWGIGSEIPEQSTEGLLEIIDHGNYAGGSTRRFWTLDPIDGTLGFISGGQYAVALALIQDSVVQVGILGCPNLPFVPSDAETYGSDGAGEGEERGVLLVAVRGEGVEQRPLSDLSKVTKLQHPSLPSLDKIALLESVQARHSSHSFSSLVSQNLGLTRAPLRMDSQAKYACLARGEGGIYFRTPIKPKPGQEQYREKIWDHAAGSICIEEAGGVVSDLRGRPLDFGLGRTLGENFGIVACYREIHKQVLEAARKARLQEEEAAKDE